MDRAEESYFAAIRRHINVLGIDLGVALERRLDRVRDHRRLDAWIERARI